MRQESTPRFLAAEKKILRAILRGIEVGGEYHPLNTGVSLCLKHGKAFFYAAAPIIHARQNVCVKINHHTCAALWLP